MIQTWKNIVLDFRQPVSYLIPATIIALVVFCLLIVWTKKRLRLSWGLFLIYAEVLLQTAYFSREQGTRTGIDLDLFGTWGHTATAHAYFIENIMMFIPFGILMPIAFKKMRKGRWCVLAGFLCSCGIELSQLLTSRGYCQLDDVVTNTVGALIGWGVWRVCENLFNRLQKENGD